MADENEDIVDYQEEDMYTDIPENGATGEEGTGEEEPEEMQKRVQEMEEELEHLTKMQQSVDSQIVTATEKIDENSVYVAQVDYAATPAELQAHFAPCGVINRVTIICDKITGKAKGFAYIEFETKEGMENALKLEDSVFKGRQLKVTPKRQNVPVLRGRGRGFTRGGGRGAPFIHGGYQAGRVPSGYGRGGFVPRGGRSFPPRGGRFVPRGGGRGGRGAPAYFNSYY